MPRATTRLQCVEELTSIKGDFKRITASFQFHMHQLKSTMQNIQAQVERKLEEQGGSLWQAGNSSGRHEEQWQLVEQSLCKTLPYVSPATRGCKTVRLFISSTFADMFCERDLIVKNVVPGLRYWGEPLKLRIFEVDLRWYDDKI